MCIQINELKIDCERSFWGEKDTRNYITYIKEKLFIAMWFSCLFVVVGGNFFSARKNFSCLRQKCVCLRERAALGIASSKIYYDVVHFSARWLFMRLINTMVRGQVFKYVFEEEKNFEAF